MTAESKKLQYVVSVDLLSLKKIAENFKHVQIQSNLTYNSIMMTRVHRPPPVFFPD